MRESVKFAILALLFGVNIEIGSAEIYKWVDANGKVHYSQTPPDHDAEKIQLKEGIHESEPDQAQTGSVKKQPSSVENQKRYSDYLERERLDRKEKREEKKQLQAKQRLECNQARADLEDMNQGGILYYELDESGERKFIAEERIEARKNKLRDYLKRNCGSG